MKAFRLSRIAIAALMAGSVGFAQAATLTRSVEGNGNDQPLSTTQVASQPDAAALQAAADAMQAKVTMINRITDRFQGDAASQYVSGFDGTDWRYAFGSRLMHQPDSVLATALAAGNLSAAQTVLASKTGGTLKHTGETDLSVNFLSTPCRIVDTRFGGGGLLGPSSRLWYASNTPAVIAAQGGAAAGCPQNGNASAWLLNVTVVPTGAVGSGGANFLTVQHDSGAPTVASMTYYPGTILSNFATTLCQGCSGGVGGFYAYASLNTHVVIDLVGFAGTPALDTMWAAVDAAGVIDRSLGATTSLGLGSGSYEVIFNRDVTGCVYNATIGTPNASAATGQISVAQRAGNINGVFVSTRDSAGAAAVKPFYLSVNCP